MASIGENLSSCLRISPSTGGISSQAKKVFVYWDGAWREAKKVMIANDAGAIDKAVKVGIGRLGDVNGDGTITIADYTMIRNYYLGNLSLTADQFYRADVNQDGAVNETDGTLLQTYIQNGGT